jgi:hypothetical protein
LEWSFFAAVAVSRLDSSTQAYALLPDLTSIVVLLRHTNTIIPTVEAVALSLTYRVYLVVNFLSEREFLELTF